MIGLKWLVEIQEGGADIEIDCDGFTALVSADGLGCCRAGLSLKNAFFCENFTVRCELSTLLFVRSHQIHLGYLMN